MSDTITAHEAIRNALDDAAAVYSAIGDGDGRYLEITLGQFRRLALAREALAGVAEALEHRTEPVPTPAERGASFASDLFDSLRLSNEVLAQQVRR